MSTQHVRLAVARLNQNNQPPIQMGFSKWLSATLAVAVSSLSFAGQDEKVWDVAVAKDSAGNVRRIVRYRSEMPNWVQRPSFGALVVISWPNVNQAGMPTKRESELHYAFEDGLQAAEERNRAGVLAAVVTGDGKVEWYYLARSHDEFMRVLNEALQGKPRLPITISLEQDPEWSMYRSLAGRR
ncbi:DUF695 domain-containing protein [Ralstonia solanacearum]|uniref:DUF695 domain-containing protein n=1 Tax=Ralstonia solanacearum TaxID=305 RepID=UPI0012D36079|nr:DUF695 domain-containing protein [Ralstonia solanacearum]MDB0527806.1 DUF695 domain-containing protein [Ralstonia solanacearum]